MKSKNPLLSAIRQRHGGTVEDLTTALGEGPWLCVAPHDDDVCLGMGLTVAAACAAGIEVHLAVCTDGAMGYRQPEDQQAIAGTRRAELIASCAALGIASNRIHQLDLPDGALCCLRGALARENGQHGGLGRLLAGVLRRIRPRVVFGPNIADVHPDHQAVSADLDIACFWAASAIWLELGPPIDLPVRWDYAVYAPFPTDPDLRLCGTEAGRAAKVAAFAAFASQQYVAEQLATTEPIEHLRQVTWAALRPAQYDHLFTAAS